MELSNISHLTSGSHEKAWVECDFKVSPRCKQKILKTIKTINRDRAKTEGKDICFFCSRQTKYTGASNPNNKYSIPTDLMDSIDTPAKAYLLGWIASDGHVNKGGIYIQIHSKDLAILHTLKNSIGLENLPIVTSPDGSRVALSINSKSVAISVCKWLGIEPGKKARSVAFPKAIPEELKWDFVRGLFDGDGSIRKPNSKKGRRHPECNIASISDPMKDGIEEFCQIPGRRYSEGITWGGANCIDFLGKLYDNETQLRLHRKYDTFLDWCLWVPALTGPGNSGRDSLLYWARTHKDATPPTKTRISDSGYDLSLVAKIKDIGPISMYDTGIKILPAQGWYFDLVARSSMVKLGYMLANCVGVIDRSYTGNILVPLIKINPEAPDIELPVRCVQIIPRPIVHFRTVEVKELDATQRAAGGFGSTGS